MKKLNVVLFEPEIPQNTGNIMRTCVGFDVKLHLIKPLGFSLEDKYVKRSSVDYMPFLDYVVYENIDEFFSKNTGAFFYLTRYGHKTPGQIEFKEINDENLYFVFGKESTGIPYEILSKNLENCYRIPTTDKVRSLNLSNCVALVLFQALHKLDYPNLIMHEPDTLKGENFIDNFLKK